LQAQGAGNRVRFLGPVSPDALAGLRASAAIALVPSRSAETFGLAAAEAMASGLPVAASRVGALGELLEPDALVPPGNAPALAEAIVGLAGDRAVGEQNRRRIRERFSPEVVAAALAEIYDGAGREPANT
jgi:glycosyltransferase involved in cell wall biosynthesis